MTTRNLSALFTPKAIAMIGASNQPGSVGHVAARNLLAGGFEGSILPVNPHDETVCGVKAYHSIADLPEQPDLAVIATPPRTIPGLIAELGAKGCRAAVVITAGFDAPLRQAMLDAARPYLLRIMGPNCLGFLSPVRGINASFSHMAPLRGRLALLTQSGAIATSIIDWANGRNIGFSHVLSLGDMADADFGDFLDWLALDPDTQAILLYAENVTQARKFMSAGRIAARAKPVIVVKSGRSAAGAKAAASHTGALAGADAVYAAAFRRAGMLRVETLRDLFDAAETLASGVKVAGDRLAILTNGGGLGVLAADALEAGGGRLAPLSQATSAALDGVLPASWSHGNPVDILGDAHGDRYEKALDIVSAAPDSDAILVMNCPTGVADNRDAADAVLRARERNPRRPMIACWMGEASAQGPRRTLFEAGMPNYETPDEAVRAFLRLVEYGRNQRALYETPSRMLPRGPARREEARDLIKRVLAEGRSILTEPEAKAVLAAYGVPIVETRSVTSAEEAAKAAAEIGGRVALKILSRQISHKTDVGGVRLDLEGAEAVGRAAREMLERVARERPDATIDGFTVQQMIKRPQAQEVLLGAVVDATFGPCILFGHGGVATEVIADRTIGLPPLNAALALDMIGRTRVSRLLAGYRDRPRADHDAIASALVAISELVIDLPEVAELDINPLLADADGVIALDARVVVRAAVDTPTRLAIRPWPNDLTRTVELDGWSGDVRPIRPEDANRLVEMADRTRPEDLRLRFHGALGRIDAQTASRLTQIDYDREMALVAEEPDGALAGVGRLVFDPDFLTAECAVIVRSDAQGHGLGAYLMQAILDYGHGRGAARIWGDVAADNRRMLDLADRLGATREPRAPDPRMTRVLFLAR